MRRGVVPNKDPQQDVHFHAALAAALVNPDAIDKAMVDSLGPKKSLLTEEYEQLKVIPFDPVSKKSAAVIRRKSDGHVFKVCKGAPQVVWLFSFPFLFLPFFLWQT